MASDDMATLSPEQIGEVSLLAAEFATLPRGSRTAWLQQKAVGISVTTLLRRMKQVGFASGRKRRADAGRCSISKEEAELVSNIMRQATGENGKRRATVEQACTHVRANGKGAVGRLDTATGELLPVSASTVSRAMRSHGVHPDQVARQTPHVRMRVEHPNAEWQMDGSVCVLYKMGHGGLGVMEDSEYYKNKIERLRSLGRVESLLVRQLVVDACSGAFRLRYYLGAESAEQFCDALTWAMQRGPGGPMHGAPARLVVDPGAGNAQLVRRYCRALAISLMAHRPKNPRAKGVVEGLHNIVEREFEHRLAFQRVDTLADLQGMADEWAESWQAHATHSRHGMSRASAWMRITRAQLRIAPPVEICHALIATAPETRVVAGDLTISFAVPGYGSQRYRVDGVPGVLVGQEVLVSISPYQAPAVQVVGVGADGEEQIHTVAPIELDEWGYPADAPIRGQAFDRRADTPADQARKAMDEAAWGSAERLDIERARAARTPAFGGALDAFADVRAAPAPEYMPKAGEPVEAPAAHRVVEQPMNWVAAAKRLRDALGPEGFSSVREFARRKFAAGATPAALESFIAARGTGAADRAQEACQ